MIHVVEAISDTNIGGAGILLLNRLDYMEKDLFKITVILPKNSLLESKVRKKGVEVYPIDGCYNKSFDMKSLPEYVMALKMLKPDIVNSHGCMNARIASRIIGVKASIFTRHCDFPIKELYKNKFIKVIVGKMNLFLNGVQLTYSLPNDLYKIYDENNIFVGMGVVNDNLLKIENEIYSFVFVANRSGCLFKENSHLNKRINAMPNNDHVNQ